MKIRKLFAVMVMCLTFLGLSSLVEAYNGKFSYHLTSGMWSPWAYSPVAYKVTNNENPVVQATHVSGNTSKFIYDVVNSNDQSKVVVMEKTGIFGLTEFEGTTARAGYQYRLRVRRNGAEFWHSATTQGLWNPDSY